MRPQGSDAVIAIVDNDPSVREGAEQSDSVCGLRGPNRRVRAGIPGLEGELLETDAHQLKWAWKTARSILNGPTGPGSALWL